MAALKPRLGPRNLAELSPEQRKMYDSIVGPPRNAPPLPDGSLPGPFNAYAYCTPEIADAAERMGDAIRFHGSLPNNIFELTLLAVGTHWQSNFEFAVHAVIAKKVGVSPAVIEAVRLDEPPSNVPFASDSEGLVEKAVYTFAREYLRNKRVSDATYALTLEAFEGSEMKIVDLTMTIGYYGNVCALLNVFNVATPRGLKTPFKEPSLQALSMNPVAAVTPSRTITKAHEPWGDVQPLVKAYDMVWIRFSCPDLAKMKHFIDDFGLQIAHYSEGCDGKQGVLYSRGIDERYPICHIVHEGPAKFIGFAMAVPSEADLHVLARSVPGCSPVEAIDGVEGQLAGGKRVSFIDPVCGLLIEVLHGQRRTPAPTPSRRDRIEYNYGTPSEYKRLGRMMDVGNRTNGGGKPGVPEVRRLGHVVVSVPMPKVKPMTVFMHDTFGLIGSDTNMTPDGKQIISQFLHMDRGKEHSDHHSFFILPGRGKGDDAQLSHVAYEVQSIDDVFRGHFHLKSRANEDRLKHSWGIGRHLQGSQVYDYWHDPWGHCHEHWCDGDQVNEDNEHRAWLPSEMDGAGDQWGPTEHESTVTNLMGPDRDEIGFGALPERTQNDILSRDLTGVAHVDVVARALQRKQDAGTVSGPPRASKL